jgi:hypothetical protein
MKTKSNTDKQWVASRRGNLIVELIVTQPAGMRVSRHGIASTSSREVARYRECVGVWEYYMFAILEDQAREDHKGCNVALRVVAGEVVSW